MDWKRIKERNAMAVGHFLRLALRLLGIRAGDIRDAVPPPLYWRVLAILRPAEAALRRLIAIHAAGLAQTVVPCREGAADPARQRRKPPTECAESTRLPPRFRLFDRRKRFEPQKVSRPRRPPRITVLGLDEWTPYPAPKPRDPTAPRDAETLCRRLWAASLALDDPEGHARRMLRWRAHRTAARAAGKPVKFVDPLRPGLPPGSRLHRRGPLHELVLDLDRLARMAWRSPA